MASLRSLGSSQAEEAYLARASPRGGGSLGLARTSPGALGLTRSSPGPLGLSRSSPSMSHSRGGSFSSLARLPGAAGLASPQPPPSLDLITSDMFFGRPDAEDEEEDGASVASDGGSAGARSGRSSPGPLEKGVGGRSRWAPRPVHCV